MRHAACSVIAAAVALLIASGACSDAIEHEPSSSSSSSSGAGDGGMGGSQEGGSGGGVDSGCVETDGVVLALDELFLGDTDWSGTPSLVAWQSFGRDLDDLETQGGDLTGHCQPSSGAPVSKLNDGDGGLDNSFGRNLLPLLLSLEADFSQAVNSSINDGAFSLLLALVELGDAADQDPLLARLYGGATMNSAPAWDGQDCWPLVRSQLADPTDITSTLTTFSAATLQANAFDSQTTGTVLLPIIVAGLDLKLTIRQARITMDLDSAHSSATGGIIAGALDTEEFVEVMRLAFGAIDPSFCDSMTWPSVADQIRQASDIMSDGTQDPMSTCDGISIGIGFGMAEAQLGPVALPDPPIVDPCLEG